MYGDVSESEGCDNEGARGGKRGRGDRRGHGDEVRRITKKKMRLEV